MASIQTKTINGYGPYSYRVAYDGDEQHWEYLGKAGEVDATNDDGEPDLEDLDPAEAGQMMARGEIGSEPVEDVAEDGGYSARDVESVEFGDRESANAVRDEIPDEHLAESDDRRTKTIELSPEATRATRTRVTGEAADSRAYLADQHGQAELTDAEKRRLDFTRTNVMHARSAKAILQGEGVDDWTAHYDPELTVDEHRGVAERARRDDRGQRMDHEEREGAQAKRHADAYNKAQSQLEKRAREACEEGHDEACDELRDLGWSDEEIEQLEHYSRDAEDFARNMNDERKDAGVSPAAGD